MSSDHSSYISILYFSGNYPFRLLTPIDCDTPILPVLIFYSTVRTRRYRLHPLGVSLTVCVPSPPSVPPVMAIFNPRHARSHNACTRSWCCPYKVFSITLTPPNVLLPLLNSPNRFCPPLCEQHPPLADGYGLSHSTPVPWLPINSLGTIDWIWRACTNDSLRALLCAGASIRLSSFRVILHFNLKTRLVRDNAYPRSWCCRIKFFQFTPGKLVVPFLLMRPRFCHANA